MLCYSKYFSEIQEPDVHRVIHRLSLSEMEGKRFVAAYVELPVLRWLDKHDMSLDEELL